MKNFHMIIILALGIGLVFMIIEFETRGKELREQQEAYAELQNENSYLKFNGSDVQNCPLCGSGEIGLGSGVHQYWVACKECHMNGSWCETVEEAVNAWNSLKKVNDM